MGKILYAMLFLATLLLGCAFTGITVDLGGEEATPLPATGVSLPTSTPVPLATEPARTTTTSGGSGSISKPEATATPTAESGAIAGKLSYPSEFIPPLRIVAFAADSDAWYAVETEVNQQNYVLEGLPPGIYHVVAYVRDMPQSGLAGGYSQMVPCGLSVDCTDHSLIDVEVRAGETTTGIDPGDWYAPEGAFPPDPAG